MGKKKKENDRIENDRFHPSLPPSRKRSFCACSGLPRHVDVIEGNLPREVGSLRGSDYNTSEFIHRRDSSAPEVTRRESASPKLVACARAHESSTSLAERAVERLKSV